MAMSGTSLPCLPASMKGHKPIGEQRPGKRRARQGVVPQVFLLRVPWILRAKRAGRAAVPMKIAQAGFMAYVRNPPRPNQMPSYSAKAVPDADMADIYA